jgi:hypothetical protein
MADLEIWSDSDVEAHWFKSLSPLLANARESRIAGRSANTEVINSLIKYDRPDIILLDGETPILVLEKTREVPTGHNVGQRFARLVRAAEQNIPVIYFLPFDAMKHGSYAGMCHINLRLLKAMSRMSDIHNVPVLPLNWKCDLNGELIVDGSEDASIKLIVESLINSYPQKFNKETEQLNSEIEIEFQRRMNDFPNYENLPNSAEFMKTSEIIAQLDSNVVLHNTFRSRKRSLVYTMDMAPDKCRRQDPYTGMQFVYDYGWLRNGPQPLNRSENLVLRIPRVDVETWRLNNPNDLSTKSCNWYLTADLIWLADGVIRIEH